MSQFFSRTLIALLLLIVLAACGPATQTPTTSPTRTPTQKAGRTLTPTIPVTETPRPTRTPTPAATLEVQKVGTVTATPSGKKPTATPTHQPTQQTVKFNPSGDLPDDINEQLYWGGGGGGAGDPCLIDDTNTTLRAEATFEGGQAIEIPILYAFEYSIRFYGLKKNVEAALIAPDGSRQPIEILYTYDDSAPYCGFFDIPSSPDMQTGTYRVEVVQGSDLLTYDYEIAYSDDPRLVLVYNNDTTEVRAWLSGFDPAEQVRVIVYTLDNSVYAKFFGQQIISLPQGRGLIGGLPDQSIVYAVGSLSGVVKDPFALVPADSVIRPEIDCPGALAPRLWPGGDGRVSTDNLGRLIVRKQPGKLSAELTRLEEGTEFYVNSGPVCSDGWLWWEIYTLDWKVNGWIAEGGSRYFVEPVK